MSMKEIAPSLRHGKEFSAILREKGMLEITDGATHVILPWPDWIEIGEKHCKEKSDKEAGTVTKKPSYADEKVREFIDNFCFTEKGKLYLRTDAEGIGNIQSFLRSAIRDAVKEYDELLCLEHNCKEMDGIEQYFAGFRRVAKLSEIRKQALARFGAGDDGK